MADSKITDLTEKSTGAASDEFIINDVAGGNVDKKMGMDGLRITESQITDLGSYITASSTDTLTNKTIDGDNNTISNLAHGAEVDNPSSGVHGVTGSVVGTTDSQTLTNKTIDADNNTISNLALGAEVSGTVDDNVFTIQDNSDNSKKVVFQASGITTSTTRTLTIPDRSFTLAGTDDKLDAFASTTKAELESVISDVADFAEADGDTYSGTHDFNSATITLPANSVDSDQYVDGSIDDAHLSTTEDAMLADIVLILDGGGSAITTGIKADIQVDFNCTIEQVTMLADQSGSIVVDIWKDTYANFPATDADSITASAVPTISTATKSQDNTLTGWTTSITAGDHLRFNVDSASTITRCTIALRVRKT